jgi:hypothetical protein
MGQAHRKKDQQKNRNEMNGTEDEGGVTHLLEV